MDAPLPHPGLVSAVSKLALVGQRAGFSIDEIIRMLNGGLTVEELLELIELRLEKTATSDMSA
jgi:hypothetical protein